MSKTPRQRQLPATHEEYQNFSEQFADAILDIRRPWLLRFLLAGGFGEIIMNDDYIASGEFAFQVYRRLQMLERDLFAFEPDLYEAAMHGDKKRLAGILKSKAQEERLPREAMAMVLSYTQTKTLKRSLRGMWSSFDLSRGPKRKVTPAQYADLLNISDQLRPAIERLLSELETKTAHGIPEILQFLKKDYPEACQVLLHHSGMLEKCLHDKTLLKRARIRRVARAKVLADAMSGSAHDLSPRTSVEYVGQARRRSRPKKFL